MIYGEKKNKPFDISYIINQFVNQPNYSYEASSLSVNDEFITKQWALYNDGSFYMEEQKNEFPAFDMPFNIPTPHIPGQIPNQMPFGMRW